MCLLLLAINSHPHYRLVVAENRDEFFSRPTAAADYWEDAPGVLGGRDLERGGTWFGVSLSGRWGAVTNYRDFHHRRYSRLSRGRLVSRFLRDGAPPEQFLTVLEEDDGHYAGLNFIGGDMRRTIYFSNTGGGSRVLADGVYGLSNHWLDTGWPKVAGAKEDFKKWLAAASTDSDRLFALLADRTLAPDGQLPDTGVGLEWERALSARFICGDDYGTRASTLFLVDRSGVATFSEKSFDHRGKEAGLRTFRFPLSPLTPDTA